MSKSVIYKYEQKCGRICLEFSKKESLTTNLPLATSSPNKTVDTKEKHGYIGTVEVHYPKVSYFNPLYDLFEPDWAPPKLAVKHSDGDLCTFNIMVREPDVNRGFQDLLQFWQKKYDETPNGQFLYRMQNVVCKPKFDRASRKWLDPPFGQIRRAYLLIQVMGDIKFSRLQDIGDRWGCVLDVFRLLQNTFEELFPKFPIFPEDYIPRDHQSHDKTMDCTDDQDDEDS